MHVCMVIALQQSNGNHRDAKTFDVCKLSMEEIAGNYYIVVCSCMFVFGGWIICPMYFWVIVPVYPYDLAIVH